MTDFEKWCDKMREHKRPIAPHEIYAAKTAYLAGQASAEQRVYELLALVEDWKKQHAELERERDEYLAAKLVEEPLRRQIALLERERDQWKYTAEIRQQHLEYTIKAQAGEPIYGMAQQRQLNPSPQVRSDVGSLGNTHPTPEPVKVSEPVMPAYGQITWQKLIDAIGEATGVAWEPDDSYYIGHQPVSINMNSLNRIVSKFSHPTTERRAPKPITDEEIK